MQPDGGLAMTFRNSANGTITRVSGAPGVEWAVTHSLPVGNTPGGSFLAFATSGDRFAAARLEAGREVLVAGNGAGQSTVPETVSTTGLVAYEAPKLHWNPDGSLTALWTEGSPTSSQGTQLKLRRWQAGIGWNPEEFLDVSTELSYFRITPLPNGRGLITYSRAWTGSPGEIVAQRLDARGLPDETAVRIDDAPVGPSNIYSLRTVPQSAGLVASWMENPAGGGNCLVSRVWRAGSWSSQSCVNAASVAGAVWEWSVSAHRAGPAVALWRGSDIRVSVRTEGGTWGMEQVVTDDVSTAAQLQAAICPDGRATVVWSANESVDGKTDGVVYGRQRSRSGQWGPRTELARSTDKGPIYLQVEADDTCGFTASWAMGGSGGHDLVVRRWGGDGTLAAAETIASAISIATTYDPIRRYYYYSGFVRMAVDASGRTVFAWRNGRDTYLHLRVYK
jgi:hypothetical protein